MSWRVFAKLSAYSISRCLSCGLTSVFLLRLWRAAREPPRLSRRVFSWCSDQTAASWSSWSVCSTWCCFLACRTTTNNELTYSDTMFLVNFFYCFTLMFCLKQQFFNSFVLQLHLCVICLRTIIQISAVHIVRQPYMIVCLVYTFSDPITFLTPG